MELSDRVDAILVAFRDRLYDFHVVRESEGGGRITGKEVRPAVGFI